MTTTLSRPECANTLWPNLSGFYLTACASKFIFNFRCNFDTTWIDLKTSFVKWQLNVSTWKFERIVADNKWTPFGREHFQIHFRTGCNLKKIQFILENWSKNNVCKMAAVLSRPQCVNTLMSRQSSFNFVDDASISIFEFGRNLHQNTISCLKIKKDKCYRDLFAHVWSPLPD